MPPPPAKKIKESQLVFVYGKKNLSMVPVDTIIVVVFSDLDNRVCMTCSIESAFIAILCGLFDCQFIYFYRDIFEESFFFLYISVQNSIFYLLCCILIKRKVQ